MLKRSDGEYLLTKELYDNLIEGTSHKYPRETRYFHGDSCLYIYLPASYTGHYNFSFLLDDKIIYLDSKTLEEAKIEARAKICSFNLIDDPLPSEDAVENKINMIINELNMIKDKLNA